jgi:predicted transcriptional regulator
MTDKTVRISDVTHAKLTELASGLGQPLPDVLAVAIVRSVEKIDRVLQRALKKGGKSNGSKKRS